MITVSGIIFPSAARRKRTEEEEIEEEEEEEDISVRYRSRSASRNPAHGSSSEIPIKFINLSHGGDVCPLCRPEPVSSSRLPRPPRASRPPYNSKIQITYSIRCEWARALALARRRRPSRPEKEEEDMGDGEVSGVADGEGLALSVEEGTKGRVR